MAQAQALGEFQLLVARLDGVEGGGLQSAAQGLALYRNFLRWAP